MSTTRGSLNGKSSKRFTGCAGKPLLVRSSVHPEARVAAIARTVYGSLMVGLANFDHATPILRHKCREIAIAVLDAESRAASRSATGGSHEVPKANRE